MSDKKSDNPRSRDDARLHKVVSDAHEWMQREGIEDQPLDWDAIAREEQAQWWRERLRQVFRSATQLIHRGLMLGQSIQAFLHTEVSFERGATQIERRTGIQFDISGRTGFLTIFGVDENNEMHLCKGYLFQNSSNTEYKIFYCLKVSGSATIEVEKVYLHYQAFLTDVEIFLPEEIGKTNDVSIAEIQIILNFIEALESGEVSYHAITVSSEN